MANVALNKNAAASNSMFPYQPGKAVDGVLTPLNRWVGSSPLPPSGTPAPTWLRVDLGAVYWINRWVVKQMGAVGWSSNYNLQDYKLQGSLDNANWFDIDTVTNNSANSTDRAVTPQKVRWARIYVTKGLRCNTNFASIVDLEVYEAANAPSLTGLNLSTTSETSIPLTPVFSSYTYSYTTGVDNSVPSVNVTPTAAAGTIRVNTTTTPSGTPVNVPLHDGTNTITVTVTSADGLMTETYTVVVNKSAGSAYLSALVVNGIRGSMNPAFNKTTMAYTASVAGGVSSVTVTPTAEEAGATILVNDTYTVPNGGTSPALSLVVGSNEITIKVTNGSSSQTYTVIVSRPS